jgi:ubiquinone/menaquinone biosynthesis C-methylase UbiE
MLVSERSVLLKGLRRREYYPTCDTARSTMDSQGSYQIAAIASNIEKEIQRLRAQVDLFWEQESKHYIEFGLRDGMSIVELGAGPGFLTEKLGATFSDLKVTAVELDPFLVDYAKKYVAQTSFDHYEILQCSLMETGLATDSFDFAITRLVLEHLPQPIDAVQEILRIVKPGGKAVFVDNDFSMHILTYPHIAALGELYHAYCQSREAEGGNPRIGRELPTLLKSAGFSKVSFEVICAHSEMIGDEPFLASEGIGIPSKLVQDGFLSSKVLAKIAVEWRNMLKSPKHAILRQLFMVCGEKPLEETPSSS